MYCFAQYGHRDSNRVGIILCKPVYLEYKELTKPGLGWNGGLSIRGNFTIIGHGLWYSIQNNFTVYKEQLLVNEDVNLKLASAQISLQLSYRLIKHILSIEFGPIVQGGKFKSEYDKENNIISGTPVC
jgi:hypothetical protein